MLSKPVSGLAFIRLSSPLRFEAEGGEDVAPVTSGKLDLGAPYIQATSDPDTRTAVQLSESVDLTNCSQIKILVSAMSVGNNSLYCHDTKQDSIVALYDTKGGNMWDANRNTAGAPMVTANWPDTGSHIYTTTAQDVTDGKAPAEGLYQYEVVFDVSELTHVGELWLAHTGGPFVAIYSVELIA